MKAPEIIFESTALIIINKESGIITEESPFEPFTAESQVRHYLNKGHKPPFVGVAHRLDRVTSGLLIFAKKKSTLKQLNQWFADRKIQKTYLAIASTPPSPSQGTLEHHLFTDKAAKKSLVYDHPKGGTKPARLHYRTLEVNEHGVLLEIKPSTGRFHQIRAQLSHIGCPILGDEKYGGFKLSPNTIALHAWKIKLPEAIQDSSLHYEASSKWNSILKSGKY
ncbi:MAG: RNA pseudouridine synthase [Schleiferiaceae bacterium]|nr:RNA pseudouridine synthase [Schleiferiaceae bacterium]